MAWVFYVLKMTPEEAGKYTPIEILDLFNGYLWRRQQYENTIGALVSCYIANFAGKTTKRNVTIKDIFKDGRFKPKKQRDDREIIKELWGNVRKGSQT